MNHENRRTEFCGTSAGANGERPAKRIAAADRRERLLETAAEEFACAGLRGTTTAALAKRAGISEPVLYIHFENKDRLFRETVERSVEKRLRMLEANPAQVDDDTLVDCVERMAEATVAVCLSDAANAALTAWALLEAPE
jgi:AcrR family transcriptional regulator